jgi:hypothetical protein
VRAERPTSGVQKIIVSVATSAATAVVAWSFLTHAAQAATPSTGHLPSTATQSQAVSSAVTRAASSTTSSTAATAATIPSGVPHGTLLRYVPANVRSGAGWHWNGTAVVIDANNVHLNALDIYGAVHNTHSGLVVTRSRIRCVYERSWCITMGQGSLLMQSEVGGGANLRTIVPAMGVLSGDYRAAIATNRIAYTNIHHTVHGMRIDGNTVVDFSHIWGMPMGDPGFTTTHSDAIMCTAGNNVYVHHNVIETGNTSTFFVQWETGNVGISNYLVESNRFVAVTKHGQQSSYGVMIENLGIKGPVTVRNNLFTHGWQVGPILVPRHAVPYGNRWYPSLTPVPVAYS